jgi:hypothetical protein
VYEQTNTLGDIDSRYTVSAVVTWEVSWLASDGQSGVFTTLTTSVDNPSVHVGQLRAVVVADGVPR